MSRPLLLLLLAALAFAAPAPPADAAGADGATLHRIAVGMPDPSVWSVDGTHFQLFGSGPLVTTATAGPDGTCCRTTALSRTPAWADASKWIWAPTVFPYTQEKKGTAAFALYFSAVDADTGQRCLGTAKAKALAGPYVPTPAEWCPSDANLEAIDPTMVEANGQRYIVFKTSNHNQAPFQILALPMANALDFGAGSPLVVKQGSHRMENPTFFTHEGQWWMLLSRSDYTTCKYSTDAFSSAGFPKGFRKRKRLASQSLTKNAQGTHRKGLCGPGGATTIGDVFIVLHAYTAAQGPGEGKPRNAWAGLLAWDSAGLPYID
jgi:hypothetical protein